MKFGISTCTYTWNFGVEGYPFPETPFTAKELLETAHSHGVGLVQILDNIISLDVYTNAQLDSIAETARRLGIELEIGTLGITPRRLGQYLEIAGRLGATLVRTIMDGDGKHPTVAQGATWIREMLPAYRGAGVAIAIENHDLRKVSELATLMRTVDDPMVGICIDLVNSLGAQECQEQVVETLAPYINNLHYKDFTIQRLDHSMGFLVNGCVAGKGLTDIDRILSLMKRYHRDANMILEQWVPYMGSIEATVAMERQWADEAIPYLQQKCKTW
ncbi:sugar phosphate isomerase/epimerase family protein [Anaerotruncus rubiinfantis]|uniref:sugar phosphate isomerase/epimerase family protein n=1 Tax=Anaerotruncus rubiinfantis TaxID=1720200 RepID=UPI0034A26949